MKRILLILLLFFNIVFAENFYKLNIDSIKASYTSNKILMDVIDKIESNKKWKNKFFYLEDYTDFNLNTFFELYYKLLEFENNVIMNKLRLNGSNDFYNYNDNEIKRMLKIKNEIYNLLAKNPRNYNNYENLIKDFLMLMGIKNNIENRLNYRFNYGLKDIYEKKYVVNDEVLKDAVAKHTLKELDEIFAIKLLNYINDLHNNIAEHKGWYLRFFGKSIKNIKKDKTWQVKY